MTFRHQRNNPFLLCSCQNNLDFSSTNPFTFCSLLFLMTVRLTIFQGFVTVEFYIPSMQAADKLSFQVKCNSLQFRVAALQQHPLPKKKKN